MSKPILRATDLYRSYHMGRTEVKVLRGASLAVQRGEFLAIMGASGSGKSTLLHLLCALDLPDKGTIEFAGRDLMKMGDAGRRSYRGHDVGFIFQFYHLLPECNVLENILIPRMVTQSMRGWWKSRRSARRDAEELLERVGLLDRAKHRPGELSGGEMQRVAIARSLINRPALLLADEPTGNLDAAIGGEILTLIEDLNAAGQTIVMVTHDPNIASRAHRMVRLVRGVVRKGDCPGGADVPVQQATREVTP